MNFTSTSNGHSVTGLTNGTTYSFQVRANNNQGSGPDSDPVTATPVGPPAAPVDLTAKAFDGQIKVYWANPDDDRITKWQYRYSTVSNSQGNPVWEPGWSDIAVADLKGTNNLRYEKAGLTNGTLYTFQIRGVSDGGAGPSSSTFMTPATGETAPRGIINLQWTEDNLWAVFTWNQGDDSVNKYEYRSSKISNAFSETDSWTSIEGSVTTFRHYPGDTPTRFYQFRPVNTDADPEAPGPITDETVTITNTPDPSAEPPTAPQGLSASAEFSSSQWDGTVTWTTLSGSSADKFQMRRSENDGEYSDWANIPSSSASTTLALASALTAGRKYIFQVRGVDTTPDPDVDGAVATSNSVTPGAPIKFVADADLFQAALDLLWATGSGSTDGVTVTGYEYRFRASSDTGFSPWTRVTGSGAADDGYYDVPNLAPGTSYDFQVRAVGSSGGVTDIKGEPSNIATIAIANPPATGKPTDLTATGVANGVRLTWTNPGDSTITVYRYRSTTTVDSGTNEPTFADSWTAFSNDAALTKYTVTRLTAGTTYYFQILANNANGDGPESATVSAAAQAAVDGSWSYRVDVRPGAITAGSDDGSQVTLVATWTADSADEGNIVRLSASGAGSVQAEVESASPQLVGFGGNTGDLSYQSSSQPPLGHAPVPHRTPSSASSRSRTAPTFSMRRRPPWPNCIIPCL